MTSHKQKKVELYVNTKQMSLPEFEEEKFIFDRSKNEDFLHVNLNEISNCRKYGYGQVPLIKKPLNIPILKNKFSTKPSLPIIKENENKKIIRKPLETLENYSLGKIIGQGSYATVRYALDKETNLKYAVKIYENYRLVDPQKKRNLQREIGLLEKLDHPCIIKLYKIVKTSTSTNLIMEFIGTTSLNNYIKSKSEKTLIDEEIRFIFKQVCQAVNYCHSKNIVHRDVKMENILINEQRQIKLIDFGFSVQIGLDNKLNVYCGTPSYMSPEIQSRKDYYGPPVDVWALGVMLFAMSCGRFPFKYDEKETTTSNPNKFSYSFPENLNPKVKSLISKMLKIDPLLRLTTEEVLNDEWINEEKD